MAKLHLDENFDNVQVEVQAVADPVFVDANKEHDENKENYEAAMEANEEATEGLTPEEGESIEVDKRDVLKKMHLEESLFSEPTPFDIRNRIEFMNSIDEIRDYCDQYPEIDYEFTDKEIRVYLDDNFVTSKYLDELYESLNEEVEDNKKDLYDAYLTAIREEQNNSNADMSPYSVLKTLRDKRTGWDSFVDDWATDFNLNIEDARAVMICALDAFLDGSLDEDFKKGDKFKNQNNATIEILDADDNDVTYEVKSENDSIGDARRTISKSMEVVLDKNGYEKISESMEEIDRQVFGSLNKETREPGVYYVLVDQNFDHKIYADSDEEAIEKFRAQLNENLKVGEETSDFSRNQKLNILKYLKSIHFEDVEVLEDLLNLPWNALILDDEFRLWVGDEQVGVEEFNVFKPFKEYKIALNESLTEETNHRYINIDDLADIKYSNLYDAYNCGAVSLIIYDTMMHNEKFDTGLMEENDIDPDAVLVEINEFAKDLGVKFVLDSNYVESLNESCKNTHKRRRPLKESIKAEDYPEEWEEAKEIINNLDCYVADVDKSDLKDGYVSVLMKDKNSNFSAWVDCHRDKYGDVSGEWNQYMFYLLNSKAIIQCLVQDSEEAFEACVLEAEREAENILPNESLNESLIYNVAKEQLQRFTEGKMGDSWDPKTYLERLESKKYLNEEQIKNLTESLNIKEENSLE